MLADCLHDLTLLGPGGVRALMSALFLAGLAGGVTHCAGKCAPFVLAQAAATADRAASGGALRRLAGAALVPYHAGRMLGYATLGALAGGAAGVVTQASGVRFLLAALLAVAAVLMLGQASARLAAWGCRACRRRALHPRWSGASGACWRRRQAGAASGWG
jgi:uncharacterized protein